MMNNRNLKRDRFQAIPARESRLQAGLANHRGFTLVELLIVIAMMMIMTGVLSQLWIGMERINRLASETSSHTLRGELLLERIAQDARQAVRVEVNEQNFIGFTQLKSDGTITKVRYAIEEGELIRQETSGGEAKSNLVGRLNKGRLYISAQEDSLLRITWEVDILMQPGVSRTLTRVKTIHRPGGAT